MSETVIGIFSNHEEAHRAADLMRRLPDPGVKVKISQRRARQNPGSGYGPVAYHAGPVSMMSISPEVGVLPGLSGGNRQQQPGQASTAVEVSCDAALAQTVAAQLRAAGAVQVRV